MSTDSRTRRRLTLTRAIVAAMLAPAAIVATVTPALPPTAMASTGATQYLFGSQGFTDPRLSINTAGDIAVIGNSNLSCNGATSGCAAARNGSGRINNNDWPLVWIDVDQDPTTGNSTSADLALPTDGTVLWAGLYWGGVRPGNRRVDPRVTPLTDTEQSVRLKRPGTTEYVDVQAERFHLITATGSEYAAFAEVTDLIADGGAGTYFVADLWSLPAYNTYAGWSLAVAYAAQSEPVRSLSVFDGFRVITTSSSSTVTIPLSGFRTPPAGDVNTTLGFMALEGDRGASGDVLLLNGAQASSGSARPGSNFFYSSVTTQSADTTARNPGYRNTLGFDTGLAAVPTGALGNDATSATLVSRTVGDNYNIAMLSFATELYAPKFDQSIEITRSGPGASPPVWAGEAKYGDELTVSLSATLRDDNADGTQLRTVIPTGLTIDPATLSLPPGATHTLVDGVLTVDIGAVDVDTDITVSFVVTVEGVGTNPAGSVRLLDFEMTGEGRTSEVAVSQTSDRERIAIETTSADLSTKLTWVDSEPTIGDTTATAGETASFTVDVRNSGPLAAPATVGIDLPSGSTATAVTAPGWTCTPPTPSPTTTRLSCTIDSLAPATTAPRLVVELDVPAAAVEGSELTATATASVTGGAPADPIPGNDSTAATAAVISKTDLGIGIARSGATAVGSTVTYTLTATNAGPSAAGSAPNSAVTVTTELSDDLTFSAAAGAGWTCTRAGRTITCSRAALGAGQTAPPITITATAARTGTISTSAVVGGGGLDRNADNDRAVDSTLSALRAMLIESVNNGEPLDINTSVPTDADIRVYNAGPSPLPAGTVVTHTVEFPQGADLDTHTPANGWTCDPAEGIGPFTTECSTTLSAPWSARTVLPVLTLSVRADEVAVPDGPLVMVSTVSTDLDALVVASETATARTDLLVNDSADLTITATERVEISSIGEPRGAQLTVTNLGEAPDPGPITVAVYPPAHLDLTPPTSGPWSCRVADGVMTCTLPGPLVSGAVTAPIEFEVGTDGPVETRSDELAALVTSEFSDPDPSNNGALTEVRLAGGFVPLPPSRLVDTRPSSGGTGPVPGGSVVEVDLGPVLDPTRALGAVINITAVDDLGTVPDDGRVGYISAYPCDESLPQVSNLNYVAGGLASNTAITRIGDEGRICLYVSDAVNVIVDITGWFSEGYDGNRPERLIDTRGPGGTARPVEAHTVTRVPVAGRHGVPAEAVGAALNVTAVNPLAAGYLTVWDCTTPQPATSTLNFAPRRPFWAVANFSVSDLGDDGEACVYTSAATDLVVDVFGWFDDTFTPVDSTRLLDTRDSEAVGAGESVRVQITGRADVPELARSIAVTVTAVEADEAGFATVYACEDPPPGVSNLNFAAGGTVANTTYIGLDADGGLCVYTSATADYLLDVAGWFSTEVTPD